MKKYALLLLCSMLLQLPLLAQGILIKNVNVISMVSEGDMRRMDVLIKEDKIAEMGADIPKSKKYTVIDGTGKYLLPGLADMHLHLADTGGVKAQMRMNMAAGVTQARVMRNSQMVADNGQDMVMPNLHYGYVISARDSFTPEQIDSLMRSIHAGPYDFVKLLSVSDKATFELIMAASKTYGVDVCGHFPRYAQNGKWASPDMKELVSSNYRSIEHLGGYDKLEDEAELLSAIALTKEHNLYNCPTLDWDIIAYDLQYPEEYKRRLTYTTLPASIIKKWEVGYANDIEKAGGADKVIENRDSHLAGFERKQRILKLLYDNECPLLIGGDAGNNFQADGFNIYEEMVNWSKVGIDNYTILESATVNPSKYFGEQNLWGTIEAGKNADLILLESNPLADIRNIATVKTIIQGGKVYEKAGLMAGY